MAGHNLEHKYRKSAAAKIPLINSIKVNGYNS